jgi:mRNA interferase MazF
MVVARFSIWLVDLNPVAGSEQAGTCPVLVLSPDAMNARLNTVLAAPMTTQMRHWPTRVAIHHAGKEGEVALDQIRTIDKSRLIQPRGSLDASRHAALFSTLAAIFSE